MRAVLVLPTEAAITFVERHRCSVCWGMLATRPAEEPHSEIICCAKEESECSAVGFVTAAYTERARQENMDLYMEAWRLIPDILDPGRKNRTTTDVLDKLGF